MKRFISLRPLLLVTSALIVVCPAFAGTLTIDDFETSDISTWSAYRTQVTWSAGGAGGSAGALQVQEGDGVNASTASAFARKTFAVPQDWTDYTTLEFDAKTLPQSGFPQPSSNGFSVLVYNADASAVLRAFRPTSVFQTFLIDISGAERDRVNKFLFYVNRTSQNAGQMLIVDNIRLTTNPVPPPDPLMIFENFDSSSQFAANWDYTHPSASKSIVDISAETSPLVSKPNAGQISLIGSSTSAYARRIFTYRTPGSQLNTEGPAQDWQPYKSLIFEAKVIPEQPLRPPVEAGYVLNPVNGGAVSVGGSGYSGLVDSRDLKFYPTTAWQTISLDITDMSREQITGFRVYINRSDKWFNLTAGQKLLIDNMRVSIEPAPAVPPTPALVDDFESGIDTWWRYYSTTGTWYSGGTQGAKCLQITDTSTSGSSAYLRKTMLADWSAYKTLIFDAMMFNSLTDQGFRAQIRNFEAYQFEHPFSPSTTWETYRIDLTGDTRSEVNALLFRTNRTSQFHGQQLFVDNIRLSAEPAETVVGTVGAARSLRDGNEVQIPGAVVTGFYASITIDPYYPTDPKRHAFFIEDVERPSGLPVMMGKQLAGSTLVINPGDKVTVTGFLATEYGQRFIYARGLSVNSSGNPLPEPLVCTQRDAAGGTAVGGAGLDNTGMLITLVGKVYGGLPVPDGRYYYYVDDGSKVRSDDPNTPGAKVYMPGGWFLNPGSYIRVTGHLVNEKDSTTGNIIRALWVRTLADGFTPDYTELLAAAP